MAQDNPLDAALRLTDDDLRARMHEAVAKERAATSLLIALLAEFDTRQLYLAEGCGSLFAYCTDVLHLSEYATYARIQAARAARKWPALLDALSGGAITLTTVVKLAPHFTDANVRALIREATHLRKLDVERIVARLRPQPDAPSVIRKLPATASAADFKRPGIMASLSLDRGLAPPADPARTPSPLAPAEHTTLVPAPDGRGEVALPATPRAPGRPSVILPLTPERYKLQITLDRETHDRLRHAQHLMRHMVPDGDPAVVISRALRVLVEDLLRKKAALVARAGQSGNAREGGHGGSRTIPAAVRRAVWIRDEGRCRFEGPRGRCQELDFIEYHHVVPFARSGAATVDNIELRCRAHNIYEARLAGLERPAVYAKT